MADESVLSGSVGEGGANRSPDVGLVQILLNVMRGMQSKVLLPVDGSCGPRTVAAIREFQKEFAPATDGRVDPGGATLRLLIYSYITIMRMGVYGLGQFPPWFGHLTFNAQPETRELGMMLRDGLNDIKRGITPLLKGASGSSPTQPRTPDREPRTIEEQNV